MAAMTESTADQIKAAEARGYSRGYQAGKKRKQREHLARMNEEKRRSFAERVFIALLPAAMQVQGWNFGDPQKPVTSSKDRVELAARWARIAVAKRYEL